MADSSTNSIARKCKLESTMVMNEIRQAGTHTDLRVIPKFHETVVILAALLLRGIIKEIKQNGPT